MVWRVLIVVGVIILILIGTYLVHWLFNAKEWIEIYMKNRTIPHRSLSKKPASFLSQLELKYDLKIRAKFIEFLNKKEPQKATISIYFIVLSGLVLIIFGLIISVYFWNSL
ncbi:MAG: hypothetical protein OXF85_01555 [Candidatus Saccharibacteria bacterium]|nr:hypothetical protein [Candidatus Saccharibacteria bacterium]